MYFMIRLIDFEVYLQWNDMTCAEEVQPLDREVLVSRMTSCCAGVVMISVYEL